MKRYTALRYLLYFGVFCLFSVASYRGVRPFGIGAYVGLLFVKHNWWILSPILIAAGLVGEMSWQSAVLTASAVAVTGLTYLLAHKADKPISQNALLLASTVSQLPVLLIYGLNAQAAIEGLVYLVVNCVWSWAAMTVCRVCVKGWGNLTPWDQPAIALTYLAVGLGLARYAPWGVLIGIVGVGVLVHSTRFLREGVWYGLAMAVGVGLATNVYWAVTVALLFAVGLPLRGAHPVWTALAGLSVHLVMALALKLYSSYYFPTAILLGVGLAIPALLPRSLLKKLAEYFAPTPSMGARYLVNRTRRDLYKSLDGLGDVLEDMQAVLACGMCLLPPIKENKNQLAKDLARIVCRDCPSRVQCEQVLCASTALAMYDLITKRLDLGRVSRLEAPAFFGEYCMRTQYAVETCNRMVAQYDHRKVVADTTDEGKRMMADQLKGLAGMMKSLASDLKQTITYETKAETRLKDALSSHGVVAKEVILYRAKGIATVVLTLKEGDASKKVVSSTLRKLVGSVVKKDSKAQAGGWVTATYVTAPPLMFLTGQKAVAKAGSPASGDTYSVTPIGTDKVMLALCDGMGSGKEAHSGSESAMSLVEGFYQIGIDEDVVLDLINRLLIVHNGESFQALDMCVIDLRRGYADFIKLGAPESVIRHAGSMQVVAGGALPLGIMDEITPKVTRAKLEAGDMIVLATDGISETIGTDGIVRMCDQNPTTNPSTLAELIVEDALYVNRDDDKTVLCCRVFERE
ncbi:MAG: SpoIIE family protein phosphatase [Clostridia bacterium]|nr:SpoIIE family protein phosphatase [Clostridia bacterium]